MTPSQLKLFSDWRICDACGLPPTSRTATTKGPDVETCISISTMTTSSSRSPCVKLLSLCRNCQSAVYHNVDCQRDHWTRGGHFRDCKKLSLALQPLCQLISYYHGDDNYSKVPRFWWWWESIHEDRLEFDRVWQSSVNRWRREEYLEAMLGFQASLRPFWEMWCEEPPRNPSAITSSLRNNDDYSYAVIVSRRLLFCAYCEADGGQLESCRTRLVQCISILLQCCNESLPNAVSETLNDVELRRSS
jgi:hypothetical protein